MKRKSTITAFLSGMFVMLLLVGTILPATAAAGKNVTIYPGVNIYVDDKKIDPRGVDGNPVEVFIYNGSTYLPVRAVSEALGQPVQWDGSTTSVYIGKHTGDKPAVWLSDMDYFTKSGDWWIGKEDKDNAGVEHQHSIESPAYDGAIIYNINGQYSKLTGSYYQRYDTRSTRNQSTLSIYGDDTLLWKGTIGAGIDPIAFDVDLTGVLKLKLEISSGSPHASALGDVGLWT